MPVVSASPVYNVAAAPYASTSTFYRYGLLGRPRYAYSTTYYGPTAGYYAPAPSYGAVYGSAYYTPLYFRY